ncbi:hypothetical protein Kpol_1064p44 [Vanderwaltozyma polyspora DSM 70294]|uniref:Trafficking protein particle complex subunit 11 domain-containing protein n=1 Tax=Vanderwaltozyma polyspora (strain ATCC 22028 / DSM 70294 / BCRC 21397 / CBS 2163 / NBRC 10782 / NRRL Y-8283 / UCD 57-17) TaxID=436907 RepID=A7TMG8_VANPO|nr:uncharacterized protein Kpol_1064p44 [Vanderwaltozyma polyspora DSM 70294]EDO16562.1 hypothetical protein Kpol_1064p44 [Vanderwaltozyma polyspora DSM 70294]
MSSSGVVFSYFDPFAVFDSVKNEFLQVFPFKNIHWKTSSGLVRTIENLQVRLASEDGESNGEDPFIKFLVVTCKSVDDYRSRVRPLIRQWLPTLQERDAAQSMSMPVLLLYANSEVVDSNLFKSISLMDKFSKDFPDVKTMEIRSVYKSPQEKNEFWSQLSNQLKSSILAIFQKRLEKYLHQMDVITADSNSKFEDQLLMREKILNLYLDFKIDEEATSSLDKLKLDVQSNNKNIEIPIGSLEVPFKYSDNVHDLSVAQMFRDNTTSTFLLYKYFFYRKFELIKLKSTKNQQCIRMFSLARLFLKTINKLFKDSPNLLEFQYSFIDLMLERLPEGELSDSNISLEIKAEFLLLQRDVWLHGVFLTTGYKILRKDYKTEPVYKFDIVKKSYKDELTFQENFLKRTKEILSLFNKADGNRKRIVDILSIEVGTLYYQMEQYEKAVSIFISSYEYYTQSKWDSIGLYILQIFVLSLSKCPNLTTLQIDGDDIEIASLIANSNLEILKLLSDDKEKLEKWNSFLELQDNIKVPLLHSVDGLLHINVPKTSYISKPNTYAIKLEVNNFGIPSTIEANSMILSLKNSEDKFMKFTAKDIKIVPDKNEIVLQNKDIFYGSFYPVMLEIVVKNSTLVKEFTNNDESKLEIIKLYQPSNFSVEVRQSHQFSLDGNSLDVVYHNLKAVETFSVTVDVIPNSGKYPVSLSATSNLYSISFDNNTKMDNIPYQILDGNTNFTLRVSTNFWKKNDASSYSDVTIVKIGCYLPVSVSVEDVFKKDMFYFKFHLNSAIEKEPILLCSSKLSPPKDDDKYSVSGNFNPKTPLCLSFDSNNSCLNCYQIKSSGIFDSNDIFDLTVKFNSLKEQLDILVTDAILVQGDVNWYEKFEQWKIFWEQDILSQLYYNYMEFQKNRKIILLPNTLDIQKFQQRLLSFAIDVSVIRRIITCLKSIEKGVTLNSIDVTAYTKNMISKQLVVPVTLPEFEEFFYVEFFKESKETLKIGESVKFKIQIKNLCHQWSQCESQGSFCFEITNSNEWVVHGRKKLRFSTPEEEIEVSIIPLKKGYLTLPKIEITNYKGDLTRIDNPNAYETFLVY